MVKDTFDMEGRFMFAHKHGSGSLLRIAGTAILSGTILVGCVSNSEHQNTNTGLAVGAVAGGVIGGLLGDTRGAVIGAAAGALGGGLVGNYMDNQQREFESALAAEQRARELEIERINEETLKLSLNNEVSFDVDRAEIKPAFYDTLDKLGGVLAKYDRTVVHVVGHTDSDGTDSYNFDLSQRRAGSVASFLTNRGVLPSRVRTEGRGETEPRASNSSEAGKQLNRRVEIFIKPIIEGREQQAYLPPVAAG